MNRAPASLRAREAGRALVLVLAVDAAAVAALVAALRAFA